MLVHSRAKTRFESLGVYLPERVLTSAELMSQLAAGPIEDFEEVTGILNRRMRDESEDSYTLALKAARNCLVHSKYEPEDLDAILFVSITRFQGGLKSQADPSVSLYLKRELGARNAIHFDLSNACAGMSSGIHVLDQMIRSGAVRNGLVVSGECITPLAQAALEKVTNIDDEQFPSLTLGDSGTACILEGCSAHDAGIEFASFQTLGKFSELCLAMPNDDRPGVGMYTNASALHMEAIRRYPRFLERTLAEHGARMSDYAALIPHQTATSAIRTGIAAIKRVFKNDMPPVISIVSEYGNTSSTSHMLALHTALHDKRIKPGDRVLFLVLASGIVLGVVSFTVGSLEASYAHENRRSKRLQPGWVQQVD